MPRKYLEVDINTLCLRPQVRTASGLDDDSIARLAKSIQETGGIHQPLLVRRDGDELVILDGERRYRAAMLAKIDTVPVVIEESSLSDADVTQRQLVLDVHRADLSIIERGTAVARLMEDSKLTRDQAAQRLGVSPASVTRMLAALNLPTAIREHVLCGRIGSDCAYMLSRVEDPDEQARLASEVTEGLLTRDALTRKLKRVRRVEETKRGTRITATLGSGRTVTFAGSELTLDTVTEWLEQLLGKAKKAKAQGFTLQTFARTLRDQAKAQTQVEKGS